MNKNASNLKTWLALSVCFLVLVCSMLYYVQNRNNPNDNEHRIALTDVGFDTSITFQATCTAKEFDTYTEILRQMYTDYNALFDQYHEYEHIANVYTLNQHAYERDIEVDPELSNLISYALNIQKVFPSFDITQGDLLDLWHTYREEGIQLNDQGQSGKLPPDSQIQEALRHAGSDQIQIEENTIRFLDANLKLDLGGIAKGYATQKVKEALEQKGLKNGFINAGGNVVLIGKRTTPWRIGVQDPDGSGSVINIETNNPIAIVTSGDYQRYYMVNEVRYGHIIDPATGYPASYHRSVTILCDDSTLADALSTALYSMPLDQGKALLEKEYPEVGAIWIDTKGQGSQSPYLSTSDYDIECTDNIKKQIHLS